MKMIEYLYAGFLILSFVLIYFAMKQFNNTSHLMDNGIKTKATVIDLIPSSSSDGTTYKPVFEYMDLSQNTITFESEISSSPPAYKIGEVAKIIYSKNSDERKVVSFWGLYRWTIILLCIASPLLIIGGGYFLYSRI